MFDIRILFLSDYEALVYSDGMYFKIAAIEINICSNILIKLTYDILTPIKT